MLTNLFENKIPYDFTNIPHTVGCHYANLTDLRQVGIRRKELLKPDRPNHFILKSILDPKNLIGVYNKEKYYKLIVHPDIVTLASVFNIELYDCKCNDFEEIKIIYQDYHAKIYNLIEEVQSFIEKRYNLIANKRNSSIREISPFSINEDLNIMKMIQRLNLTLVENELASNDFVYPFINRTRYIIVTAGIYSYESLQKICRKMVEEKSEYYSYCYNSEVLKELVEEAEENVKIEPSSENIETLNNFKKKIVENNKILDELNSDPLFKKETFALLYVKLEDFVTKEKAINDFLTKILMNKLNYHMYDDKEVEIMNI